MDGIPGFAHDVLDRARLSRDSRFDGKFFIGVLSTGIYCRPICPSPTSKSANVRYYPTAAAAAEAGFRPCLRCRPEAAPGTPAWMGTSAIVRRALRLIEEGFLDEQSVEHLAAKLGIGPRHLHRLFIQHVGASPVSVAQTRRLHFAKRLLDETKLPITNVALASGYGSVRRFNSAFLQTYQRSPRELRAKRRNTSVGEERAEVVLRLAYRPPYDWRRAHDYLGARAVKGIERVDARGYARTLRLSSGAALILIRPTEGDHALEMRVQRANVCDLLQVSVAARRVFDVFADPDRIAAAFRKDPVLSPLIKRHPGLRIPGVWDPFECAVRAIVGQQVSVPAGRTLVGRIVWKLGDEIPEGSDGLTHMFPTPEAVASADLTGLGLTKARQSALQALARAVVERRVDFGAPVEDVIAAMKAVAGVGDWTAQYVALRALNELDAFPAADLVLCRMAAPHETALTARELALRAEAWRPFRGYAAMHLWAAATEKSSERQTVALAAAGEGLSRPKAASRPAESHA